MESRKKTILVVDDNRTFVLYLGILLKRMGFAVMSADNGAEALKLMEPSPPDLVLLDINMPALNGVETLHKIRADERLRHIPVIMVSGEADDELINECLVAGCNGFLNKPVPMDELHGFLQDFVYSPGGVSRKYLRVQAELKVMVFRDGAAREIRTETVSEGGIYLRTDDPFQVGTEVEVALPAEGGDSTKLNGRVVYIRGRLDDKINVPPGMAVEFHGVNEQDAAAVHRLVTELIAGDMASGAVVSMTGGSAKGA